MSDQEARFRPLVSVYRNEEDGSFRLEIDWDDSTDGEYVYHEEYDETEGIGHTDFCDEAWQWLMDVKAAYPVLGHYPQTEVMNPFKTVGAFKLDNNVMYKVQLADGNAYTIDPAQPIPNEILAQLPTDIVAKLKPKGPKFTVKVMDDTGNMVDHAPVPRRPPFNCCAWYIPPADEIESGKSVPPDDLEWPYDRFLPYPTCTNKMIVGPKGFGPCRATGPEMPGCPGYKAEEPVVMGRSTEGPTPVTLTRRRTYMGNRHWRVEKEGEEITTFVHAVSPNLEQGMAYKYFIDTVGQPPVPDDPPEVPEPASFLRSVVGAAVR